MPHITTHIKPSGETLLPFASEKVNASVSGKGLYLCRTLALLPVCPGHPGLAALEC